MQYFTSFVADHPLISCLALVGYIIATSLEIGHARQQQQRTSVRWTRSEQLARMFIYIVKNILLWPITLVVLYVEHERCEFKRQRLRIIESKLEQIAVQLSTPERLAKRYKDQLESDQEKFLHEQQELTSELNSHI